MGKATSRSKTPLPPRLALAFAPIHKRALGVAVGLTCGLLLFVVTAFHVIAHPGGSPLHLLDQYFYGYEISWRGAFVGLFWGFVTGFVGGWFVAFVRNFVTAVLIFYVRARAELAQTADFMDHI
jgi:hypothetical protein